MTPNVLKAYRDAGFKVDMGSPGNLFSRLLDIKEKRSTSCSGGCTVTDVFTFTMLSKFSKIDNIFIIGNSFGLSTFILADLFPNSKVDVIDAELEGLDVQIGSDLTKKFANETFKNVNLTLGFSPQNLKSAMRSERYNFFFVDGLHTNEQILLDYEGILPFCDDNCIIYFHDVVSCEMQESWEIIKKSGINNGFRDFTLGFTQMGCTVLVRGFEEVKEYLTLASNDFNGPYKIGFKDEKFEYNVKRPWFWDLSFGHLERVVKRKIKRIFRIA